MQRITHRFSFDRTRDPPVAVLHAGGRACSAWHVLGCWCKQNSKILTCASFPPLPSPRCLRLRTQRGCEALSDHRHVSYHSSVLSLPSHSLLGRLLILPWPAAPWHSHIHAAGNFISIKFKNCSPLQPHTNVSVWFEQARHCRRGRRGFPHVHAVLRRGLQRNKLQQVRAAC